MTYYSNLTGVQVDMLLDNVAEVMTISSILGEAYLSYQSEVTGETREYKIGNMVRVANTTADSGYDFYKLMDIKDGKAIWKIEGSGGAAQALSEKVTISISSNQAQPDVNLNGLQVHVIYGDNDNIITWNGEAQSFNVPMNMTYTIQWPTLEGYAKPADVEYIALAGNERQVNVSYNTTVMTVSLSSNQSDKSDLNTVDVVFSGSISRTVEYSGSSIVINVPTGQSLTVTPTQIAGYSTANAVTKTPTTATDSISFTYNTTILSITLASNQGTDSTINGGTNVTVVCGTVNKTLTWKGSTLTQKIPTGSNYTITPASKTGYKTPSAATGTASGTTLSKSFTYQTEVVKVTVNADNNASISGQTVTVNGETKTYSSSTLQWKVPFGTSYTVSVNAKYGYTAPANQSFTANQASRSVTMTYAEIKQGVFILDKSGNLVSRSSWNTSNNSNAVGVAILTNDTKFVIDKNATNSGNAVAWGVYGENVAGLSNITSESNAKADYDGASNTDKIIAHQGTSTGYAAQLCQILLGHGKRGYLGSLGQWQIAYNNKTEVDACMSAIGGTALGSNYYWSSTESNSDGAWNLGWSNGYVNNHGKDSTNVVSSLRQRIQFL